MAYVNKWGLDTMPRGPRTTNTLEKFIYIIEDGSGACKIGIAQDIKQRLCDLQVSSPIKLKIAYALRVPYAKARFFEGRIHKILKNRRLSGEWFYVHPDVAYDALHLVVNGLEKAQESQAARFAAVQGGTKIFCPQCTHWRVIRLPKQKLINRKFRCSKCDFLICHP